MLIISLIFFILLLLFLIYASAYIGSNVYIKTICKKRTNEKEIIITFDDGVDPINTIKILNILDKYNIKAYFFIIGEKAAKYPDIVKKISDKGHIIGIHSYYHKNNFPLQSIQNIIKELNDTKLLLENITKKNINLFRPPFGVTNPNIAKAVKFLNLTTIGWNIRSFDTVKNKNNILVRIGKSLSPGSILLLHDRLNNSDVILIETLKLIKRNGYKTSLL